MFANSCGNHENQPKMSIISQNVNYITNSRFSSSPKVPYKEKALTKES